MDLSRYILISSISCFIFFFLYSWVFMPNSGVNGFGLISIFMGVIIGILLSINRTLNEKKK
ncbi:hypothetical protein CN514_12125 [Bacillus sp. AFS001701]|nr:hypothetical protein CN514_12125 [Bacillus sp. AFS001701]